MYTYECRRQFPRNSVRKYPADTFFESFVDSDSSLSKSHYLISVRFDDLLPALKESCLHSMPSFSGMPSLIFKPLPLFLLGSGAPKNEFSFISYSIRAMGTRRRKRGGLERKGGVNFWGSPGGNMRERRYKKDGGGGKGANFVGVFLFPFFFFNPRNE